MYKPIFAAAKVSMCNLAKGEKVPIPPEEAAGPEIWSHLTEAERKMRKESYDKELKHYNDVHI